MVIVNKDECYPEEPKISGNVADSFEISEPQLVCLGDASYDRLAAYFG